MSQAHKHEEVPQKDKESGTAQTLFPISDNPAQRLLEIFANMTNHRGNQPFASVLAKAFGFREDDNVSLYRSIVYINDLIDQIEARIRQLPVTDLALYLESLPVLRNLITPTQLHESWSQRSAPLASGALTSVRFCASVLKVHHKETPIPESKLKDLRTQLDELFKSVIDDADLDADLKIVIYDLLRSARDSIDHYQIKGLDGLKQSVVYAVGLLHVHQKRFEGNSMLPTVEQVGKFVRDLTIVVAAASQMNALGIKVGEWLTLSGPP
jgi:hypothetical protein